MSIGSQTIKITSIVILHKLKIYSITLLGLFLLDPWCFAFLVHSLHVFVYLYDSRFHCTSSTINTLLSNSSAVTMPGLPWRIAVTPQERCDVSDHRQFNCLFNRVFTRTSKKTSKLCVTVTWTMFPCHDVFMGFNTYTNKTQEIENRADFLVCSVRTYVSGPTFPQLPRRLVRTTEAPSDINSVQRPHVSREVLDTSCLCLISFITIDSSHKSHSAWDKCHTIRHFVTEMRTHMPILLPNGVL